MKEHRTLEVGIWLGIGVWILGFGQAKASETGGQQKLTYVDLVQRLTNLEYLATIPALGDACAQWSSYDRASRYDEATGKYIRWDANGDGGGVIRKEGDKLVLAEMEGPGCIWRIWSATPGKGHVRIYLDGADDPVVDLPFKGYFDGQNPPFTRPALVHTVSMGWNNYTPIPYQKSCKIIADRDWGQYYHFNYETFPKGTQVPVFKRELNGNESAALDQANDLLLLCEPPSGRPRPGEKVLQQNSKVGPGKTALLAALKGPRAITVVRIKPELPTAPADQAVLRELALQIKWDSETEPSVWAPLGDFFGTAPGANEYRSLPLGLTADGWWYSAWYMPFGKEARVELVNDGKETRALALEIFHAPLARPIGQLARFHAKWHRDIFLPAEPERRIDWPVVKTEGAGRFVGMMLHIWNPRGGWWGEGDEKFFVDGEKFPSTFGTGSEDYFGYAWSSPKKFQHALHNQTHNDGNSKGHVSVNRWHIADNVPFHRSFEGDIEKYFPNEKPTLYAAMAYWYLAPGGKDPYRPVPLNQRVGYWTPVESAKIKGAIEGERLKILGKTGGNPQEQDMAGFGDKWSNDAHLWWIEAKPGDKLDLAVPVATAGRYKLTLHMTKARDYGIVQLWLDGAKLGEPIDLYNPDVVPTGPVKFGVHELSAGEHKLTVEIVGANEKAEKAYMFGLDYVKLEPE
jgi:hypothetical protein